MNILKKLNNNKVTLVILMTIFHYSSSFSQLLSKFTPGVQISMRAIAVLNDSTMWFSGTKGCFGYTEDNGRHWHMDSVKLNGVYPDFRSMAVIDPQTILLLNAGSPAYLLKSTDKGMTWKTVYSNDSPDIFFDTMKFPDAKNGIAIGDPVNGCFVILTTHDGGDHWEERDCENSPKALEGEACFAASNSCLDVIGNTIWIGTGGSQSSVLSSNDSGATWNVVKAPIQDGKQLTGIFSLDFYDPAHGIIVGGNYEEKFESSRAKAVTHDGGKSWKSVGENSLPGFCSCVQYQPFSNAKTLLMATHPGVYISNNGGKKWMQVKSKDGSAVAENFNTLQFSPTGKVAWCAGMDGKTGRISFGKEPVK